MSKEKEIEEISDIIDDTVCIDYRRSRYDCLIGSKTAAKCIIEAGYRKAEEVRKETAKEILQALWEFKEERQNGLHCEPRDGDISAIYRRGGASIAYDKLRDEIQRQCKKYGVEVDE